MQRNKTSYSIDFKNINCPICNSTENNIIYKSIHRVYIKNKLTVWPSNLAACKKCGMIFANPQPTQRSLEFYYNSALRYGEVSEDNIRAQLNFIHKNTANTCKKLFDIGAFYGSFLNIARNEYGYSVYGIEPSKEEVQKAWANYKIKLIQGFFNERFVISFDRRFDIVTISNTLEHISNPVEFLKMAAQITNINGFIYVDVPNTSLPNIRNVADFFSFEHIMNYTETSLINLASKLKLKVTAVEKGVQGHSIRILLKKEKPKSSALINEYEANKLSMKKYAMLRKRYLIKLKRIVKKKMASCKNIIVYGAGMHATQLFQAGILDGFKISNILDSDKRKEGVLFEGHIVQSPEILRNRNLPVLISSYDAQEEISKYLKMNFPHIKQIKLYTRLIHA